MNKEITTEDFISRLEGYAKSFGDTEALKKIQSFDAPEAIAFHNDYNLEPSIDVYEYYKIIMESGILDD